MADQTRDTAANSSSSSPDTTIAELAKAIEDLHADLQSVRTHLEQVRNAADVRRVAFLAVVLLAAVFYIALVGRSLLPFSALTIAGLVLWILVLTIAFAVVTWAA